MTVWGRCDFPICFLESAHSRSFIRDSGRSFEDVLPAGGDDGFTEHRHAGGTTVSFDVLDFLNDSIGCETTSLHEFP
jgi:hypothetical protein